MSKAEGKTYQRNERPGKNALRSWSCCVVAFVAAFGAPSGLDHAFFVKGSFVIDETKNRPMRDIEHVFIVDSSPSLTGIRAAIRFLRA